MIAVDTSALMAILLGEKDADNCVSVLKTEKTSLVISAGTVAEALIVAARQKSVKKMTT